MRAEVLIDLMTMLDECKADEAAKDEFRKMILSVGTVHSVGALEREERVRFARALLDAKEPRPIIRDRLKVRFQIGDSQAYRDIDKALQIVPKTAQKWDETAI